MSRHVGRHLAKRLLSLDEFWEQEKDDLLLTDYRHRFSTIFVLKLFNCVYLYVQTIRATSLGCQPNYKY